MEEKGKRRAQREENTGQPMTKQELYERRWRENLRREDSRRAGKDSRQREREEEDDADSCFSFTEST